MENTAAASTLQPSADQQLWDMSGACIPREQIANAAKMAETAFALTARNSGSFSKSRPRRSTQFLPTYPNAPVMPPSQPMANTKASPPAVFPTAKPRENPQPATGPATSPAFPVVQAGLEETQSMLTTASRVQLQRGFKRKADGRKPCWEKALVFSEAACSVTPKACNT